MSSSQAVQANHARVGASPFQKRAKYCDEQHVLGAALVTHRSEVREHRKIGPVGYTVARLRETGLGQVVVKRAELDASRLRCIQRAAAFDRHVASRERTTVSSRLTSSLRATAASQWEQATIINTKCGIAALVEGVCTRAGETEQQRKPLPALDERSAIEARRVAQRQCQLRAQATGLLKRTDDED